LRSFANGFRFPRSAGGGDAGGPVGASPAGADAAVTLIVGTIHGEILPPVLLAPPGRPVTTEPGLAGRVADTILRGIAPGPAR
jgi:hypothetical protein